MKLTKASALIAIGLSTTLLLSACGASEEPSTPEPTTSVQESPQPSPTASPAPGSSGEIDSNNAQLDLKSSEKPPTWAEPVLKGLPAGQWVYASDDTQVIATTNTYQPEALKQYVEELIANGWETTVQAEEDSGSYVTAVSNLETGENVTVVGMAKAVPDGSGTPSDPASSVVYTRS